MRVPTCTSDTTPLPHTLPRTERRDGMPQMDGPEVHYPHSMSYDEKCEADEKRVANLPSK